MANFYVCDACGAQSNWEGFPIQSWLAISPANGGKTPQHFCSWRCALIEAKAQDAKLEEATLKESGGKALRKLHGMVKGLSPWFPAVSITEKPSPDGWAYESSFTFFPTPPPSTSINVRREVSCHSLVEHDESGTLQALAMSIVADFQRAVVKKSESDARIRLFYGDNLIASFYPSGKTATPMQAGNDGRS